MWECHPSDDSHLMMISLTLEKFDLSDCREICTCVDISDSWEILHIAQFCEIFWYVWLLRNLDISHFWDFRSLTFELSWYLSLFDLSDIWERSTRVDISDFLEILISFTFGNFRHDISDFWEILNICHSWKKSWYLLLLRNLDISQFLHLSDFWEISTCNLWLSISQKWEFWVNFWEI